MSQSKIPYLSDYNTELSITINKLIELTYPITLGRLKKHKITNNTTEDQLFHIIEECVEFQQELYKTKYKKANWIAVDNENLDILFAWLALQHAVNNDRGIDKSKIFNSLKKFQERQWIKFKNETVS